MKYVPEFDHLLTPGDVARMMQVDAKTVTRWANKNQIKSIKTPGGHRRFRESDVRAILAGFDTEAGAK